MRGEQRRRPNPMVELARELRRRPTPAEELLWAGLRKRQAKGLKFRRQHPIGPYIVDFYCAALRLVVEIDGGYHRERGEEDAERSAYLRERGITLSASTIGMC